MRNKRLLILLVWLLGTLPCRAAGDVVIAHATIHPASGPAIADATLVVRDGKIISVGPSGATADTIDGRGLHVYPSLIDADTVLGLIEIEAVRATRDTNEVGQYNPNARADIAFNADSQLLPVAMSAGILVAGVTPRGGLISGRAAVMRLHGWTREDMTVKAPLGLCATWPSMKVDRHPWVKKKAEEQEKAIQKRLDEFKETFSNARAYLDARDAEKQGAAPHEQDVKWEAMRAVLRGEQPLLLRADRVDEMRAAVVWARDQKLRLVLVGAADAWRIAGELAQAKVGVIYSSVVDVPRHDFIGYDAYYRGPAVLARAGVALAISAGGEAARTRDLSDYAGRAAAYGLPELQALQAITTVPARLLGVDDRLGSLQPGKDGTFFMADGDILDTRTHVLRAWISGTEVDLNDRQKQLYQKYKSRPHTGD